MPANVNSNDMISLLVCDINEPKSIKRLWTTCTNKENFTKTIDEKVFCTFEPDQFDQDLSNQR